MSYSGLVNNEVPIALQFSTTYSTLQTKYIAYTNAMFIMKAKGVEMIFCLFDTITNSSCSSYLKIQVAKVHISKQKTKGKLVFS